MIDDLNPDERFTRAIVEGTPEAIADLLDIGPGVVDRLRRELSNEQRIVIPPGTSDRVLLDNLMWTSHEVAGSYPEEFLAAFSDERWNENPFVCGGLGAIRRTDVTERLMHILRTGTRWLRIDAAVALGGHTHPELETALVAALDDTDELVRYHAAERLAELTAEPAD